MDLKLTVAILLAFSVAILFAIGASAPSMLIVAISGGLIYWVCAARFEKIYHSKVEHQRQQDFDTNKKYQHILKTVISGLNRELAAIGDSTHKIESLLKRNVENLYTSFAGLNSTVKKQQKMLVDIVDKVSENGNYGVEEERSAEQENFSKIRYFAAEMLNTMNYFVQQILETSQDSLTMVNKTEDMLTSMVDVEKLLTDVRTISDQTNLLALNAAIEAARAGDSGRGFAVVADEVRKLSRDSNDFSKQISQVVLKVAKEVEQARNIAARLASRDMTRAIHSKGHIDEMLGDISDMEEYLSDHIGQVSTTAEAIQQNINLAVVSLQFEDLLTQIVKETQQKTLRLKQYADTVLAPLAHYQGNPSKDELDRLEQVSRQLDQSQINPVSQQAAGSDIDLF